MDYLKALRDDPDLAEEFDSLFDFFLLDELSPRDEADGRATFTLPGMAFARDGSGGEYHLLEDGSIGYYSSEGEAGRLAESMDDLFSLIVSCICWHDCCDAKEYNDLFCDLLEENAKAHPKYQGDYGDWLNWTVPDTDCNLPIFASGWGDGYYPVYFGYDAKGEICAVYVRFIDIEASYKEQA